jgi:hypothetical protein
MLRTISFVAAVAATLATPTAVLSAGTGSVGGAPAGGTGAARVGGVGGTATSSGIRGFGAAGHFSRSGNFAQPNVGTVSGFSGPRNVSSFHNGGFHRDAFFDHRFHHGRRVFFGAPIFAGYDSCWRWSQVPTPYGVTTQRVWVCGNYGDSYGGDYGY